MHFIFCHNPLYVYGELFLSMHGFRVTSVGIMGWWTFAQHRLGLVILTILY